MKLDEKIQFKLGLIINPIAGIGGKTGLKGSDGKVTIKNAFGLGAMKESASRAEEALLPLKFLTEKFKLITCSGEMGQESCNRVGIAVHRTINVNLKNTTREDTINAVSKMIKEKVALILFCGGDGTACDVYSAIKNKTPILGIPAGVKMHSSVFGTSPNAVGSILNRIIMNHSNQFPTSQAEIMDLDEDMRRCNQIRTKLIGYAVIPSDYYLVQNPKSYVQLNDEDSIMGIAKYLEKQLINEATYIIGPGRTTHNFLETLRISGSLLGVDVLKGGKLIGKDVNSIQLELLSRENPVYIISGIIGGQGFLFGRGNQQITSKIIRRVGKKNIIVVASAKKLYSLPCQRILIDTGDKKLDRELIGYIKVQTDLNLKHVIKVEAA